MPRCWPFRPRSGKEKKGSSAKSGKLPDSGSSASGSTLAGEVDSKEKKVKEDKKEEKKDEDKKDEEKKDEAKKDGEEKEKEKPKVPVGSVSEVKNIYKGASDEDGNWTWVDKYPDDVEEAAENEETATFAIVVRNQKSNDSRKKLEAHSIVVQSP
ncbi:5205ab59-1476-49f2-a0f2-aafccc9b002c [Thermothielavioides terrestris]|nr:5205ab59-1476-49f2-a0f2-aafccc9b002c [Thermothielavioides terrestris]